MRPDREIAFWSLLVGVLIYTIGYLAYCLQTQIGTLPTLLGCTALGIGVFGVILMPSSGFWSAVLVGILAVIVSRRDYIRSTAPTESADPGPATTRERKA